MRTTMLHESPRLRKLVLPLMKRLSFDFSIRHHWLPERRVFLSFFQHKGYWYHGKARERETMESFATLIPPGATVIEVGGHIGYISMWLASLVGANGRVIVFEPGPNNHRYLLRNIESLDNVEWIDSAASDCVGKVSFYCDNLTGQNNSLVSDFDVLDANASRTGIKAERIEVTVDTITLDAFCDARGIAPDFIKVDVEGAELSVVRGMRSVLRKFKPRLMIEQNGEDAGLEAELRDAGYRFLSPALQPSADGRMHYGNNFCIHSEDSLMLAGGDRAGSER
jgi:FkbM family methyltransferase